MVDHKPNYQKVTSQHSLNHEPVHLLADWLCETGGKNNTIPSITLWDFHWWSSGHYPTCRIHTPHSCLLPVVIVPAQRTREVISCCCFLNLKYMFEPASMCNLCARCPQFLDVASACWRENTPTQVFVVIFWGYLYHLSPAMDSLATLGSLGGCEDESSKGSERQEKGS